jgi:hypothetical protein
MRVPLAQHRNRAKGPSNPSTPLITSFSLYIIESNIFLYIHYISLINSLCLFMSLQNYCFIILFQCNLYSAKCQDFQFRELLFRFEPLNTVNLETATRLHLEEYP